MQTDGNGPDISESLRNAVAGLVNMLCCGARDKARDATMKSARADRFRLLATFMQVLSIHRFGFPITGLARVSGKVEIE